MTLEHEPDPLRRIPVKLPGEIRAEIGPILKAARLKRGQTLDAVAQQTRISKRFLEALENNRFDEFPALVYLRGFLKGYCEHLELDFASIWAKVEPPPAAPEPAPAAGNGGHAPAPAKAAPAHGHHAPAKPHAAQARAAESHHSTADALPAIILSVLLALGLGVWLFKDKGAANAPAASAQPAALQPLPRPVEPVLTIRLLDDAWLKISVDGAPVFEGRAPRGATQEWRPKGFVSLRATDTRALELSLNGAPVALPAPGPDGEYRVVIP